MEGSLKDVSACANMVFLAERLLASYNWFMRFAKELWEGWSYQVGSEGCSHVQCGLDCREAPGKNTCHPLERSREVKVKVIESTVPL